MKQLKVCLAALIFLLLFAYPSYSVRGGLILDSQIEFGEDDIRIDYYVTSREDNPITIENYKLNRGNLKSHTQFFGMKFEPKTLKYGQTVYLFSISEDERLLEVELQTNRGKYTFEVD